MLAVLPGLIVTYGGFAAICILGSRLGKPETFRASRSRHGRLAPATRGRC